MSAILEASNISKIYDEGAVRTQVLTGLDLTVNPMSVSLLLVPVVQAKAPCCIYWAALIPQPVVKYGYMASALIT